MENRSNRKLIIIALLLIVAGFVGLTLWRTLPFRVTGSIPNLGDKVSTSTTTIKLSFNKPLDKNFDYAKNISGPDKELVKAVRVETKNMLLELGALSPNHTYEFTLPTIRAASGQTITNYTLRLDAAYIPFNQLSKQQQALETTQDDRQEDTNPILKYLPYQADQIYVTATFPTGQNGKQSLHIDAQLFLRRSDLGSEQAAAVSRLKQAVADYIRSKGLDPAAYTIDYTINEPPATPS